MRPRKLVKRGFAALRGGRGRAVQDSLRILVLLLLLAWTAGPAKTAEPGWQKSTRHGITVTVIPVRMMEAGAGPWEFLVSLESHARGHLDALPERATLTGAGRGSEQASIEWQQPPASGFLRLGTVRFGPIAPLPKAIELSVAIPRERAPRRFRWNLAP